MKIPPSLKCAVFDPVFCEKGVVPLLGLRQRGFNVFDACERFCGSECDTGREVSNLTLDVLARTSAAVIVNEGRDCPFADHALSVARRTDGVVPVVCEASSEQPSGCLAFPRPAFRLDLRSMKAIERGMYSS